MGRLRPDALLRRGRARGEGGLRPARRGNPALAPRLGPRLQHRHLLAARRAACRPRRGDGRRLDGDRAALPARACRTRRGRDPAARRQPRRRLAEPGLARRWSARTSPRAATPTSRSALRWSTTSSSPPTSRSRTFIDWLASLGTAVVIEFVGRDDEMVQALLANREDQYDDYTPENFREPAVAASSSMRGEQSLKGGKRTIFFAEARPGRRAGLHPRRLPSTTCAGKIWPTLLVIGKNSPIAACATGWRLREGDFRSNQKSSKHSYCRWRHEASP